MCFITDRQTTVHLFSCKEGYKFRHHQQKLSFPSLEKVQEFFYRSTLYDTVKLYQQKKRSYVHFSHDETEIFNSKQLLREALSQECGGAWCEKNGRHKKYFVEKRGWFSRSFIQVTKEECFQRPEPLLVKVLGVGLGLLALSPGVTEWTRQFPLRSELAIGLVAAQQKSPLAAAVLGCSIFPTEIEGRPVNTEFQINREESGHQYSPDVAALSDGGFVVTWIRYDGEAEFLIRGNALYARRFDADGSPLGDEFLVTQNTTNFVTQRVDSLSDGGFIIIWQDEGSILGQRFNNSGDSIGTSFIVNPNTPAESLSSFGPGLAALSDNGFVVVWGDEDFINSDSYGRRYDANGTAVGTSFRINSFRDCAQEDPAVASLQTDGGFVVAWASSGDFSLCTNDQDGDGSGVYGQRYDANGNTLAGEFQVNSFTADDQKNPSLIDLISGGFVIVWESGDIQSTGGQDGDGFGIFGQRYGADGIEDGLEFQVNFNTTGDQTKPEIAAFSDGGFLVVWMGNSIQGNRIDLFGKKYDANGMVVQEEFRINSYTALDQVDPKVASLVGGGCVVVWSSNSQDGVRGGIFGQLFDQNGTPIPATGSNVPTPTPPDDPSFTGEFRVNTEVSKHQWRPSIAQLTGGKFVVIWQSDFQDGDEWGIFGQLYNENGEPTETEFQINTYTSKNQEHPQVVGVADGGFVVVWDSSDLDGHLKGIFGQRFDENRSHVDLEFQINTETHSNQRRPTVAKLSNGEFISVWTSSANQDGDLEGVFGQRFTLDGMPAGNEFQINTYTTQDQREPSVASHGNNGFVVVWQSGLSPLRSGGSGQDGSGDGIYGQRFASNGVPLLGEFLVNNYTLSNQRDPEVASLSNGGFVVVWESEGEDGSGYGIYGRRFDQNGVGLGTAFQVNTYTEGSQQDPSVASLASWGFVVVWESEDQDGDQGGIYGQRYDLNGTIVGSEFRINSYSRDRQAFPKVIGLIDEGFVVAWQSSGQDENGYSDGIYLKRFDLNGNVLGESTSLSSSLPLSSSSSVHSTVSSNSSLATIPRFSTWSSSSKSPTRTTLSRQETSLTREPLFSTSVATSSLNHEILSLADIVYGQSYSITLEGQTVGTFSISGGNGNLDPNNVNVINFQIDPGYELQDGETFTLFTIPQGEEEQWQDVVLSNDSETECVNSEGVFIEENDKTSYQVVFTFEDESCNRFSFASKITAIPALTGVL